MLGRFKRRISRTKSTGSALELKHEDIRNDTLARSSTLSPSDEQLINKLKFSDDTNLEDRPPRRLNPSIYSQGSIFTTSSQRTVFNDVDSGLLALPTEVLLTLQKYVSPSSEVALRQSCSRFYQLYSLPSFYLSGDDRFEWLCLYEKDQDVDELDQLVCGWCKDRHTKSTFPSAERRLTPGDRDCRQVWLCAHKHLGYQKTIKEIKTGHEAPFKSQSLESCSRCRENIRSRSVAERPEKGTTHADLNSPNATSLLITKIALLQAPLPKYSEKTSSGSPMYKEIFSVKDVSQALEALDFPICSHLKLSDQYLLSRFCRSCINTQKLPPGVKGPPCISEQKRDIGDPAYLGKCKQSCYTRGCKTKFMFQARESLAPDASGRRQVWLILAVYRWLGPLQTTKRDTHWIGHAVPHMTRMQMRQKWEAMEKYRGSKKPMPNWSICLLHPEDPSVRTDHVFVPYQTNPARVEDALKGVLQNFRR